MSVVDKRTKFGNRRESPLAEISTDCAFSHIDKGVIREDLYDVQMVQNASSLTSRELLRSRWEVEEDKISDDGEAW